MEAVVVVRARARRRLKGIGLALTSLLFLVGARGVQLGVSPHPKTLKSATDKRYAEVTTYGPRGDILDAEGHLLATSVQTPAVFVDPQVLRDDGVDVSALAARIAEILDQPAADVEGKLTAKGRYVRLARGVHPAVAADLMSIRLNRRRVRGLVVTENYRRYYPQGELGSALLGFVDGRGHGVSGIESAYEDVLFGSAMVGHQRVDRWGHRLDDAPRDVRSIRGMEVHTTIDRTIQRSAERALAEVMAKHAPQTATAVVVEVQTGRILAIANTPGFNANQLSDSDIRFTKNRAVTDAIEPGSVFKPFTIAAAFDAGVARPHEVLDTQGAYRAGGIRDDHPRDRMTVQEVIKYSSNVGSAQMAERLGRARFLGYIESFGFGEPTGIQTAGEAAGKRHPPGRVGLVEMATISFGQGATATGVQLAMAIATIANEGVRMRPLLVTQVVDAFGDVRMESEGGPAERVVSAEAAALVVEAMVAVTQEGGTGTRARVPGYNVAGKTGTAYKVKDGRYSATARVATFVGFAPAEAPEIALAIIVDEPSIGQRYGGVVAGPAFARIVSEVLPYRGVEPDPLLLEEAIEVVPDQPDVIDPEPLRLAWGNDGWVMPDLAGRPMRDALAGLQGTGIRVRVDGSGLLSAQAPQPGTLLRTGDTVELVFQ